MEPALGEIVLREKSLRRLRRWDLHHVLRVGEKGAVHRQSHRHPDFFVLRDAVADQHVLERFLRGCSQQRSPPISRAALATLWLAPEAPGSTKAPVPTQER